MAITQSISTRRRPVTVVLWTAQILLAAFFVMASVPKLLGDPTAVRMYGVIGAGQWFRYLTGICELSGAIGLLIPRLSGLAASGLAGVMIGASVTNLFILPGMAPAAIVTVALGVAFAVIAYARRDQTRALVALLHR